MEVGRLEPLVQAWLEVYQKKQISIWFSKWSKLVWSQSDSGRFCWSYQDEPIVTQVLTPPEYEFQHSLLCFLKCIKSKLSHHNDSYPIRCLLNALSYVQVLHLQSRSIIHQKLRKLSL